MRDITGVTFLIPVRNGEQWLAEVLEAVLAEQTGRPLEILVVDDGSTDRSRAIVAGFEGRVTVVDGPRRGAAAALNEGVRRAKYPIVCQIDQDVVVKPGWATRLVDELERFPELAAAQGYYLTPPNASIWSQVMGLDLEARYRGIVGRHVNHVCTGNTAYRAAALHEVGLFDETLGYGYDNDISYRLVQAGHRLVICPDALSLHHWRDGWWSYLRQQYGFGYGRLDLVAKHRHRVGGDDVSDWWMMLHGPAMAAAVGAALLAGVLGALGLSMWVPAGIAAMILLLLTLERSIAGITATYRFRRTAGLLFPVVHLLRDLAWVTAMGVWCGRRLTGRSSRPDHSMRPRPATGHVLERRAP